MEKLFLDGTKLKYHLKELSLWQKSQLKGPLHVEISLTSGCNQRCILCCVDHLGHKSVMLSDELLKRLPRELKMAGVKSVLLAGEGEPLLHKKAALFIDDLYTEGIDVALNSNAVLLNEDFCEKSLEKLEWARFTLQAGNLKTYNEIHRPKETDFHTACFNIQKAVSLKKDKKLKVTLGIQQILLPENLAHVYETAKLAKELGVDYFVVKRFSKHPKNSYDVPDDFYLNATSEFEKCQSLKDKKFEPIVRWNNFTQDCHRNYKKCLGLPFITQILATGKIYPCSLFFHEEDYCYGDLNKESFQELIKSKQTLSIQEKIKENQDVHKCMSYCRHHSVNQFLWQFHESPEHLNFI